MKSKHILVPLDLVRGPASALVAVQDMVEEAPVCVTLLHVIDLNIFPVQKEIAEQLRAESEAALQRLSKLFFGAEQAARTVVRFGRPAKEIAEEAKEAEADLIIMCGPKSRRTSLFRRGTAQSVVKSACCPTLVLPNMATPSGKEPERAQAPEEAYFFAEANQRVAVG